MGKQPVAGQKKSKDSISKAAAQSKGPAKVTIIRYRNGTRAKLRKRLITQYSSTGPPTIDSLQASPNSESTSPSQESSKNSKSSAPSPDSCSSDVFRTALFVQQKATASRPSTVQSPSSRPKSQRPNK